MAINFKATYEEFKMVRKIVRRFAEHVTSNEICCDLEMDILACHLNGNPIDLTALFNADDFNFIHDVCGISININRQTGKLENHFSPRCSKIKSHA